MESYLDAAPCLFFASLDDGSIVECNQTLCRKLGYKKMELVGEKLERLFTISTKIFFQTHLFPLLKMQGFADEIFITLLAKDGEHLPVLINTDRQTTDKGPVMNFVGIVVHNRKKFEDELVAARKAAETALNENTLLLEAKRQLQQNAEQLDKQLHHLNAMNTELLQFNRVVTHDLQEPLRKLFVFTSMLLESEPATTNNKTVVRIKSVLNQMRSVVSGLQQFVWLAEIKRKPVQIDLEKILRLIKAELETEYGGVKINLSVGELANIIADREQMHFLLHEILSNAVRFRKDQEQAFIHVSSNTVRLNQFKATNNKYKYEDHLRLEIRDEGLGFDVAYKDQVFELFKRLHPVSGQGVGLSLCKKIVESHDGLLAIDSQINAGTTISIFLPLLPMQTSVAGERERQVTLIAKNENQQKSDFVR